MSKPQDGESPRKPLVGYRMHGVPCGHCGQAMTWLWVFPTQFESWHEGTSFRCLVDHPPPTPPIDQTAVIEKRVDARTLPRRYVNCEQCGAKFSRRINMDNTEIPEEPKVCKACRQQTELFTHDEITRLPRSVPPHTP